MLLMVTIDCNIKRMQHQLHDEARKKKKFFGLFYTPTPGLEDHESICGKLTEILNDLAEIVKTGGQLKVDEGIARLLMGFLLAFRGHMLSNFDGRDPEREQKIKGSFAKLIAQLPFNEQKLQRGIVSFSSVQRREKKSSTDDAM